VACAARRADAAVRQGLSDTPRTAISTLPRRGHGRGLKIPSSLKVLLRPTVSVVRATRSRLGRRRQLRRTYDKAGKRLYRYQAQSAVMGDTVEIAIGTQLIRATRLVTIAAQARPAPNPRPCHSGKYSRTIKTRAPAATGRESADVVLRRRDNHLSPLWSLGFQPIWRGRRRINGPSRRSRRPEAGGRPSHGGRSCAAMNYGRVTVEQVGGSHQVVAP
jgi:hypothetical protein